ncbi:hypothetical protein E4U61_007076 [Claviceps capensis]|nr:hypothetical protein E4U61_007076 [Claviceps capensis]
MGSPETRGSLQVEPGSQWKLEEDELLLQLKKSRMNRLQGEEAKNRLARSYERGKADMWAQIATEMAVPWSEAERIHWIIGKTQMAKRGSDDSFPTTRVDIPPFQLVNAEVQARRQQQDQQRQQRQQQGVKQPKIGWSGEEEIVLFACTRDKMSWKSISALLPGRTISSCQEHYQIQRRSGTAWPQERKNKLCNLYESLKSSMWANIGEELNVPWEVAEGMHWRLGAAGMAKRARVPLSFQAAVRFAPPRTRNAEVHQHRDQEHDVVQQASHRPHSSLSQTDTAPMTHEELQRRRPPA